MSAVSAEKEEEQKKAVPLEKKLDKRGLLNLGYGYGINGLGWNYGSDYGGSQHGAPYSSHGGSSHGHYGHGHIYLGHNIDVTKTITKHIGIPQPYEVVKHIPYEVQKHVPYTVKVPVPKPYYVEKPVVHKQIVKVPVS